jgi:hypothetical protein
MEKKNGSLPINNSQQFGLIHSLLSTVHVLPFYFFKIHLNVIPPSTHLDVPRGLFPVAFREELYREMG